MGEQICIDCTPERPNNWKRVIGIVSGVRHADLDAGPGFSVYLAAGAFSKAAFLVMRTDQPAGVVSNGIRRAIASVDPAQPVLLTASLESLMADSIADQRFVVTLLTATGVLALLMALAGVYGVMAYTASRRTQEIGIRLALGATPANIQRMLFRHGFATVGIGLGLGVAGAAAVVQALREAIPRLAMGSTLAPGTAVALVLVTTALACWIPARNSTRSDPMRALRRE
jgi:putative ABC transport system permease protein